MPRRAPRVAARGLFRRVAAVLIVGWLCCLLAIIGWSTRDAAASADGGSADAIIVLGAAQYGGRPSPVLRARLDHALQVWKDRRPPRVVLTGGRREGDLISEAAAGRRYLMRRGVPSATIRLEALGRTSLASMGAAAQLLHEDDSLPARPRVILVSDPFHMLRLDVLARLHGLAPLPSPTRTSPISANRSIAIEYILRESIALPTDVGLMLWRKITGKADKN
ncbi:MAG: YdcF family protein [Gemmatimonadota bacterium]